jgi:uncharacterized protein involved in exopolysaccharide biosynthesis
MPCSKRWFWLWFAPPFLVVGVSSALWWTIMPSRYAARSTLFLSARPPKLGIGRE